MAMEALEPFVALSDKRDEHYRKRGGVTARFPDKHPAYDITAEQLPLGVWRAARAALSAARSVLDSPEAGEPSEEARDAARYRWLRATLVSPDADVVDAALDALNASCANPASPEEFDAAIDAALRSQPDTQGGNPAASPVDGKTASTEGVPGAICRCPIKGMHDASYGPCPLNLQRYPTDGVPGRDGGKSDD
jgi:hypothetical protein